MANSDPINQHFVPRCYLAEFVHPNDQKLRVFSKDGKKVRKQIPKKVFRSNHLYTIEIAGKKDYRIENSLADMEGEYATIYRDKISQKKPLTEKEHIILCVFVAAQFSRTLRAKRRHEDLIKQLIGHGEVFAAKSDVKLAQKKELEEELKEGHQKQLIRDLPHLTQILYQMNIAFLVSNDSKRHKFITSDDPCNLFNPDVQWQNFLGPGFAQKNVQLTLALSPEITVMFTWANYHGYSYARGYMIEDLNRMTRGHCDKEFVASTDKAKRIWFSPIPADLFFLLRVSKYKTMLLLHKISNRKFYGK